MRFCKLWLIGFLLMLTAYSCNKGPSVTHSGLKTKNFQTVVDGKSTALYVLKNKKGMEVCITNYGGRIVSMMVPDKEGKFRDVVLGFDSIQDYLQQKTDFGAVIGRYADYIKGGRLVIGGKVFHLSQNVSGNCFNGGENGFQDKVFDAQQLSNTKLVLTYISKNEEEGFPGNLMCSVTFKLTDDNCLDICYNADTDRPTVANLTNRIYFNLGGDPLLSNTDELLTILADYYLPINSSFIPRGRKAKVAGTPMDFRKSMPIGKNINNFRSVQIKNGQGYNHCYVLNTQEDITTVSAELVSPVTGIILAIYTTEPGIQLYSGNLLDGTLKGKHGIIYNQRAAVVLAPQKFPNSPNHPKWPSTLLKPGQKYIGHTILKFTVKK